MTEVLHTADTHLGYQQYHLPTRRSDFLAAFEQVAADAVDRGVDAVVHAGDLFHDRQPALTDVLGALSVLRTLEDADIPFLAVVGNHESRRDRQWLDLFEQLGVATRLGADPVTLGDVAIYGLDFVPRSQRGDLAYEFEPVDANHTVLVSHGLFEPFGHGNWDAREILAASTVEFDCLLLGDDHTPQTRQVSEPTDAWLTYCGSTERASASERKDRGYNLVVFDDGVDIRRRGLDTREFVYVDVELEPGEGRQHVLDRLGQYDLEEVVVVVTITGEGESIPPADIEQYATERGALATRVSDSRELAERGSHDVSFADPDRAVRERIADLGLSTAARDIDETIRSETVPDSNVSDVVESRVADLVDDADQAVFEPAPETDPSDAPDDVDCDRNDAGTGDDVDPADDVDCDRTDAGTGDDVDPADDVDCDRNDAGTGDDVDPADDVDCDRNDEPDGEGVTTGQKPPGDTSSEKAQLNEERSEPDRDSEDRQDRESQVTMEEYL